MKIERNGNEGPQLVLIHGWAMQTAMFANLVQRWRDRARLVLVDLPGHGRSRDDATSLSPMDRIVEQLKNEVGPDAIWLGWSMGGLFALRAARETNARAFIGLSTTPSFAMREGWPRWSSSGDWSEGPPGASSRPEEVRVEHIASARARVCSRRAGMVSAGTSRDGRVARRLVMMGWTSLDSKLREKSS